MTKLTLSHHLQILYDKKTNTKQLDKVINYMIYLNKNTKKKNIKFTNEQQLILIELIINFLDLNNDNSNIFIELLRNKLVPGYNIVIKVINKILQFLSIILQIIKDAIYAIDLKYKSIVDSITANINAVLIIAAWFDGTSPVVYTDPGDNAIDEVNENIDDMIQDISDNKFNDNIDESGLYINEIDESEYDFDKIKEDISGNIEDFKVQMQNIEEQLNN